MKVKTKRITIRTSGENEVVNITGQMEEFLKSSGLRNGQLTAFVSGSTASVSTIEFEPNLVEDFQEALERLAPSGIKYRHTETWGDDNGKSHVKAALMGPGITIPFEDGKLLLGTWQQAVLIEFDIKPREREVVLQAIGE
jgi:secondary thiamine-phosphate synthase enzyme